MSREFDNNMRFTLFKQEEKENEKHADYQGSIEIDGVEYWLSAWMQRSKKGVKYLSGTVKPKQPGRSGSKSQGGRRYSNDDDGW